jgi:SH3 domain-containing YSC84-like protein 1
MYRVAILLALSAIVYAQEEKPDQRLQNATAAFRQIMATPDKAIPQGLIQRAECVMIAPGVKKAAFLVGGQYGRGFASCRTTGNEWSGPAAVRLAGGSLGYQLGADSTDLFLLIMNHRGLNHLLSDKFKIGVDVTGAAGPIGRNAGAGTGVLAHAEVLCWSRTRGIFAGASLDGTVVQTDNQENEALYGKKVKDKNIIQGEVAAPPAAQPLMEELSRYPRRVKSSPPHRSGAGQ